MSILASRIKVNHNRLVVWRWLTEKTANQWANKAPNSLLWKVIGIKVEICQSIGHPICKFLNNGGTYQVSDQVSERTGNLPKDCLPRASCAKHENTYDFNIVPLTDAMNPKKCLFLGFPIFIDLTVQEPHSCTRMMFLDGIIVVSWWVRFSQPFMDLVIWTEWSGIRKSMSFASNLSLLFQIESK